MDWASFYGLLTMGVAFLAYASGSRAAQHVSLIFLSVWILTNTAVEVMGYERAPLLIPSVDAVSALLVAMVAFVQASRLAAAVFGLYVLVGAIHVAAFILHRQGTYPYYLALNVVFLIQLAAVGGACAGMVLRARAFGRRQRARSYAPRRQASMETPPETTDCTQ
jgi:hypothetical protein